jgi:CheY-like chemotaxis protein
MSGVTMQRICALRRCKRFRLSLPEGEGPEWTRMRIRMDPETDPRARNFGSPCACDEVFVAAFSRASCDIRGGRFEPCAPPRATNRLDDEKGKIGCEPNKEDTVTMTETIPTVLVVDDDPDLRAVLVDSLTEEGFHVWAVADAFAALDIARRQSLHAVLSDIALPGMDGTRFVTTIRREGLAVPVVFMSAHDPQRCLPDVPFLHKPFALDDLIALLTSILEPLQSRTDAALIAR